MDSGVVSIAALVTGDPDPRWPSQAGPQPRWRVVAVLTPTPAVDVVIPVHNEERVLAGSVRRLHAYLKHEFPFSARITLADGASTDGTLKIASQLAAEYPDVRLLRINENGRGRALAAAWLTSDAGVVAQMEVGMTSDLCELLPLLAPIVFGSERSLYRWSVSRTRPQSKARSDRWALQPGAPADAGCPRPGYASPDQCIARRRRPAHPPNCRKPRLALRHRAPCRAERAGLRIHEMRVG